MRKPTKRNSSSNDIRPGVNAGVSSVELSPPRPRAGGGHNVVSIASGDTVIELAPSFEGTMGNHRAPGGTPYSPHDDATTATMLEAIGVDDIDALYPIPDELTYDGSLDIEAHSERETRTDITSVLQNNDDLIEFLGRGHYDHYVPSVVDHLADRSEFLTSYTQYQPEASQGFLQALFEYQSILSELTGLEIANASLNDAATALGEAARMAARLRQVDGTRVLIPELTPQRVRAVLDNYVDGTSLTVETYPMADANVDTEALADQADDDVALIYARSPTIRGTLEEQLETVAAIAADNDALFTLGSDPIALSVLEEPARLGVDIVVGDASVLGVPNSYGMGLGLFATREEFLRQLPGRLSGVTEDAAGNRVYTMVLQTRLQHIRRERATSNICTNAAWTALRTAMHTALLGPSGLTELADQAIREPATLATKLDTIPGVSAPVHDRHHFREFVVETTRPADDIAAALLDRGFAVHVVGDHELQICVTETNAAHTDGLVTAMRAVASVEEVAQ